jgi:CRISPR-associated endonuclease/helicase Cas3
MDVIQRFTGRFQSLTATKDGAGFAPYPWQIRLFERMVAGRLPDALDIPTGLGKTSVMTIWLLARLENPALPRRLVYVVDRRAVVDQATDEAERLAQRLAEHPDLCAAASSPTIANGARIPRIRPLWSARWT